MAEATVTTEGLYPDSEGGWICKKHKEERGSEKYASNCYRCLEDEKRRLKTIVDDLIKVKQYADGGTALISNQGQALDGYSELANYRAIIEKAK